MQQERRVQILAKLAEEKPCTVRQLALLCGVSYKTVQNDLAALNELLAQRGTATSIGSRSGIGVFVQGDPAALAQLAADLRSQPRAAQRPDDMRWQTLLAAFALARSAYIRADDLAQELGFSKSALSALLRRLRGELAPYGLRIEARPHYGMQLKGQEADIRRFMTELLLPRSVPERCTLCGVALEAFARFGELVLADVRSFQLPISESRLQELIVYLMAASVRLAGGNRLEADGAAAPNRGSKEWGLAEKLFALLPDGQQAGDAEIPYLCRLLQSKRSYEGGEADGLVDKKALDASLGRIFALIAEKYGFELSQDIELYTSFVLHITPLIGRARLGAFAVNPILAEIKRSYPLPFEMAVDAALVLDEDFGIELTENETSYLAIYLHLALERRKQRITPKRVLVVCPAGRGMSQLMAHNVKQQFGEYISKLDTCGFCELEEADLSQYDYVFSASPLERELPLPTVILPLPSGGAAVARVKRRLAGEGAAGAGLADLTPRSLFFHSGLCPRTRDELLAQLAGAIGAEVPLHRDFLPLVMERERAFSTELDNLVAFPHPIRAASERSFLAVAVLCKPLLWDKREVRVVFLGSIVREQDGRDMQQFYHAFSRFVSEREYIVRLIEKPTYETFLAIAEEIQKEIQ